MRLSVCAVFSLLTALPSITNVAHAQSCPTARDYWPTSGWKHASPAAEGMDSAMVDSAMHAFGANKDSYAAMVVRHGYVVAERHYNGGDSTTRYQLRSATKTIVSILVGLAIDQKLLHGVNQSVSSLLPEAFRADSVDPRKRKITLWNLLTMTSGLAWTEGRGANVLNYQPNWALAILNQPMVSDPGARFNYSSGNAHLLSTIVQHVSHQTTVGFANQFLFEPIGFTLPLLEWSTDPQGVNVGGAGLNLTADEMARLGYLFLNEGCWDGKQVVSKKWVDESTKRSVGAYNEKSQGYGYLWWRSVKVPGAYAAEGHGGQYIFVDATHDAVIVVTADPNGGGDVFGPAINLIEPAFH